MAVIRTVFGRSDPHIVAARGDYQADQLAGGIGPEEEPLPSALDALAAEAATVVQRAGDLGGTAEAPRVVGLRGVTIATTQPAAGHALIYSAARQRWEPGDPVITRVTPAPWRLLYQVDFTAQPVFGGGGPGHYTIDDKSWWLQGPPGSNAVATLNARGLVRTAVQISSGDQAALDLARAVWWFSFAQVPDFDATLPYAVTFCIAETVSVAVDGQGPHATGTGPFGGLASLPNSATWPAADIDRYGTFAGQPSYAGMVPDASDVHFDPATGVYCTKLAFSSTGNGLATCNAPVPYTRNLLKLVVMSCPGARLVQATSDSGSMSSADLNAPCIWIDDTLATWELGYHALSSPGFAFGLSIPAADFRGAPLASAALERLAIYQPTP